MDTEREEGDEGKVEDSADKKINKKLIRRSRVKGRWGPERNHDLLRERYLDTTVKRWVCADEFVHKVPDQTTLFETRHAPWNKAVYSPPRLIT